MIAMTAPQTAQKRRGFATRMERGIAVLTLEGDGAPLTFTPALARDLTQAVEGLRADPSVRAVVLRGEESFVGGEDLRHVRALRFASEAEERAREAAQALGRLGEGDKPVVAAIHGPALGGGLALALACTATVASDDPGTVLGLPEVSLGLMPCANALLRIAERAGLRAAAELALTGRRVRPYEARALGLVDEVVPAAELLDAALALAERLASYPAARVRLQRERGRARGLASFERALVDRTPLGQAAFFRRARSEARDRGAHLPAPNAVLDVLERYARRGLRSAANLEAVLHGELLVSCESRRLVELAVARRELDRESVLGPGERAEPAPVSRVAVLGAGLMGAGIAAVSAEAGLTVHMKDRDERAVARARRYVHARLDERAREGAITPAARTRARERLTATTGDDALRDADLVIEAVFEDLALKHDVLSHVEEVVRPDCVIASNTSSIPIARIAEGASHPERVVGMHYGSPVYARALVEVVRTDQTSARAVATAVALARRQHKTAIVVRDSAGFYTTRIVQRYVYEALHLASEGVPVDAVDEALVAFGFPMGPLHLLDETGIDLAARIAPTLAVLGARFEPPRALEALARDDRRGRKNGRGFYLYGRGPRAEKRADDTVYPALGATSRRRSRASQNEVAARCTLAMINEALRCLDDDVLQCARDGDVGAVLGVGFPAFRGGPFRYVDVLGAPEVLRRTRALEQRFGARFEPAPRLVTMARRGRRFY